MTKRSWLHIIAIFALLFIVDWYLYFRHAGHFFQDDTIFLLNHRAQSVGDFLKEFIQLNPSGWYRPLANELFESILYPIARLNPIPYRIPVYAVFFTLTIAVYVLARMLTRRRLAAAPAVFFFSIHTTNAYTTYDLGFMPELLYAFFYVTATLAYLKYLEHTGRAAYWSSLLLFIGALLSKEAAVTLPVTLFLAGMVFGFASLSVRERCIRSVRSILPHTLILVAYLGFVVGYLQVQNVSLAKLFDWSEQPSPGSYQPSLNAGTLRNADLAFSWSFNIPRGEWQPVQLGAAMLGYLKFFRVVVVGLAALMLMTSQRKVVLFGVAWFWITIAPALTLATHFIAYYLFVPVVGLSLVVGLVFCRSYDLLTRFQPVVAGVVVAAASAGVLAITSRTIDANIRLNPLLGGSSSVAWNTLNDLKRSYPTLPAGTTLYFADADQTLVGHHDFGGLIKMAYGTDRISTLYQSQGAALLPETENALIFGVRNGRLVDETADRLFNPVRVMKFVESDIELDLSTTDVTSGDEYILWIKNFKNPNVRIAYTRDDGPLEIFSSALDVDGKAVFNVSSSTKKGIYKFWAFSVSSDEWARTGRILTVH